MKVHGLVCASVLILLTACGGGSSTANDDANIQDTAPLESNNDNGQSESETEAQSESETEAQSESETEAQSESETEAQSESETEAQSESETEAQSESETEAQSESETEAQSESETEALFGVSNVAGNWVRSFYEHRNSESSSPSINRPIQYERVFDRERELLGYNPRYLPGRAYFDEKNLPWIYVQNNNQIFGDSGEYVHVSGVTDQPTGKQLTDVTYDNRQFLNRYDETNPCTRCDDYILRLTEDGSWVQLSLYDLGNELGFDVPPQGGDDSGRWRYRENIYFQSNGDVFFALHHGIAHYRKSSNSWHGIPRRGIGRNHTMVGDGESAPIFVASRWPEFDEIVVVQLLSDGNGLYRAESFDVEHDYNISYDYPSNWVVKHDKYLHIAGTSENPDDFGRQDFNTANIYLRLDLETKSLDSVFMGWTGNGSFKAPDNHNKPIIMIDDDGYLQFISGAHGHKIWHVSSLLPVTDSQWSNNNSKWDASVVAADKFTKAPSAPVLEFVNDSPEESGVSYVSTRPGGHTYPEAIIDSGNNIHLFLRNTRFAENNAGIRYRYLAYYHGKSEGQGQITWEDRGDIVKPSWSSYSNYKHLVTQDRSDNIYLAYTYEIQNFYDDQWFNAATGDRNISSLSECRALSNDDDCVDVKIEHINRWPDEPLSDLGSYGYAQEFIHGPVLLGGFNGGTLWGFATTEQFLTRKK